MFAIARKIRAPQRAPSLALALVVMIFVGIAGPQANPARSKHVNPASDDQLGTHSTRAALLIQERDQLLDQSYELAKTFPGDEQISYLGELARVAADMKPRPKQSSEWSLELFRRAATARSAGDRMIGQEDALKLLAPVDPQLAVDILLEMTFQQPKPGEMVDEDPRATSAIVVFPNFLVKVKLRDLSRIRRVANSIAETGQYPYRAMADTMRNLPERLKGETEAIVLDALRFYRSEQGFANRDNEFFALLSSLKDSAVSQELAAQAAEAFVIRLQSSPLPTPQTYYAEIRTANDKVFSFVDRNEALLFRAFPLIRRYAPALAVKLQKQNPKLSNATESMRYAEGAYLSGDPTSEEAQQQRLKWLQESLLQRIQATKDCDPVAAEGEAQRISDLNSRIIGFSEVVPSMAQVNLPEARRIFGEQLKALNNLSGSGKGDLKAFATVAKAAYFVGETKRYESLNIWIFSKAVRSLVQDQNYPNPEKSEGIEILRELVIFAASQPSDILKEKFEGMPSGLKAYLLLYEAAGQGHRLHSRSGGHCNSQLAQ